MNEKENKREGGAVQVETTEPTETKPVVDYAVMDEKLERVRKLLMEHRPQLALDRLLHLLQQGVFEPGELWRAYYRLATCYFELLDMEKAADAYWVALNHPEGMPYRLQCDYYSNYLFILHYLPHADRAFLRERNFIYDQLCAGAQSYASYPRHHEKLRVGYIAPTFRETVVSFFSVQLLTRYDRSRFEVYLYSMRPDDRDTPLEQDLAKSVSKWRSFGMWDDRQAIADTIHGDEIDILFDLTVHTEGGPTLQAMKYHPAPVQIAGIGYMSTSGMRAMDYFLTDVYLDPPGEHDEDFSEALVRLPHSHFCYTPPERVLRRKRFWQPHRTILFASFNNFAKLNEDILLLWKRILERVPKAQLLLKNSSGRTWILRRIKDRVRRLGFPMDRVIIEGNTADYLDRYADVDILLDSYPYTGGGTTCDALLCGVPVITKYGDRHGTRFSYSLLANAGLADLAADNDDAYVEKAVALANDRELLAALHEKIPELMKASPIMDGAGYVRDIEKAYLCMWQAYQARAPKREIFI